MRLVMVAGPPGSGKTSMIRTVSSEHEFCFIANNDQSAEMMSDICRVTDSFPFKSPCARIRQYRYRLDLMLGHGPKMIITEPPGNCMETSSPMLNPIFVGCKDRVSIGPLITVLDGRKMVSFTKRTAEGLKTANMIDEADVIVITFSELMSADERHMVDTSIRSINDEARVLFFSSVTKENADVLAEEIFGDSEYSRPLYY